MAERTAKFGTWDWDIASGTIMWSDGSYLLFEYPVGTPVTYEMWRSRVYAAEVERVEQLIQEAWKRGGGYDLEYTIVLPSGTKRRINSRGEVVERRRGKPVRMTGINYDVTDRDMAQDELSRQQEQLHRVHEEISRKHKELLQTYQKQIQAARQLRETTALIRAISNESEDAIFAKDRSGKLTFANPATLSLIGKPEKEVLGHTDEEILEDKDVARQVMANDRRIMENGVAEQIEEMVPMPDGTRKMWLSSKVPYRDHEGNVVGLLGVSRDITARKRAEEELKKSEARYHSLFDNLVEGFFLAEIVCDANGAPIDFRYLDANPAFEPLTGLKRESAIGKTARELLPGIEKQWITTFGRVALTGEPVRTCDYAAPLGRYYETVAYSPKRGQFACLFSDITERKQAEDAVRASEERHRVLANTMLHGIVHQRADGTIIDMNPAAEHILGKTRAEFLGSSSVQQELHTVREDGSPFPGMEHPSMVALRTGQPVRGVPMGVFNPRLREYRRIEIDAVPVYSGRDDKPSEVYTVFADVTDRRRAEEALRLSEREFRNLADAMPQIVWTADPSGIVTYYNRRWYDLTAGAASTSLDDAWLLVLHPDDCQKAIDLWHKCVETGAQYQIEYRFKFPSSSEYRWHLGRAIPVRDDAGKILRWYGTCTDIHDLKMTEAALLRSEKLASVGRMAATVAHEVNNPLAAVTNLIFLAQHHQECPEAIRAYLETASTELKRVSHVTRQVLGFYRGSAVAASVSLPQIIDEAADLFSNRIGANRIELRKQYKTETRVTAVSQELRQIVSNLLANSLDAVGGSGVVQIRVSNCVLKNGGPGVRLTIADDGSGISQEARPNIFEPLFTTKNSVGTGLGLWISKQLVEKHGGIIHFRSRESGPRRGSTFSITFPAATERTATHTTAGL